MAPQTVTRRISPEEKKNFQEFEEKMKGKPFFPEKTEKANTLLKGTNIEEVFKKKKSKNKK